MKRGSIGGAGEEAGGGGELLRKFGDEGGRECMSVYSKLLNNFRHQLPTTFPSTFANRNRETFPFPKEIPSAGEDVWWCGDRRGPKRRRGQWACCIIEQSLFTRTN